jgi:CelD/BcsL family acetyltransferase involved in cellulose biosynthesis
MLAPPPAHHVEWRPLCELGDIVEAWTQLCARAAEPNVFYEPAFALAAAPVFGRDVGAVLVWEEGGRLLGLFPLRRARPHMAVLTGWTHPFAPLGTPLVDRDMLSPTIAAFLHHLAGEPRCPKLLMLPLIATQGRVAAAFADALAAHGTKSRDFDAHQRPLLMPGGVGRYLEARDGRRRRKLARARKKLEDDGGLSSEIDAAPDCVASTLADFFVLEASGWKGRAGTAAIQHPDIAAFVTAAVTALATEGKAVGARLIHGGDTIATNIVLRSGSGAWSWKIAYDESAARASPGMQVLLDVTEWLTAEQSVAWCDSCAAPDQPAYDAVWPDRLAVADRLIAVTPQAPFGLACRLEAWRRSARAAVKTARDRLRRMR